MMTLPLPFNGWERVNKRDPLAWALAERHYSRQTAGADDFMPPGKSFVLRTTDARAVWGACLNQFHGVWPFIALTTEIDATKVRPKAQPGACFIAAGWREVRVVRSHRLGGGTLHVLEAPL